MFVEQFPLDPDSAAMSEGTTENCHVLHTGNTAIHVKLQQDDIASTGETPAVHYPALLISEPKRTTEESEGIEHS